MDPTPPQSSKPSRGAIVSLRKPSEHQFAGKMIVAEVTGENRQAIVTVVWFEAGIRKTAAYYFDTLDLEINPSDSMRRDLLPLLESAA